MGQPAARLGDLTAHGGTITLGFPGVFIGGLPAARFGDLHVCPMVTVLVPHVGGPIAFGSLTVLIGGQPAARQGDPVICVGPPDTIAMGCPTVLIGDSASAGGGAGGAGSAALKASAAASAIGSGAGTAAGAAGGATDKVEGHYLDVKFVDKGGFPITGVGYKLTAPDKVTSRGDLMGEVKRTGIEPGNYEIELKAIVNPKWSKSVAKVGEKVQMTAETAGIESGEKALLEVKVRDTNASDKVFKTIETKVNNGKIEGEWELVVDKEFLGVQENTIKRSGYSSPTYYFEARAAGVSQRSGLLEYKDDIELKLKEESGAPIPDKKYRLVLASGEVKEGTLDGSGAAKVTDVTPGVVKVAFNLRDEKFPGK